MERGTLVLGYGKYIPNVHFKPLRRKSSKSYGWPTNSLSYAHLIHTCTDTLEYSERAREILPASGKIFSYTSRHFNRIDLNHQRLEAKISKEVSKNRKLGNLEKEIIRLFRTRGKKKKENGER